MSNTNYLLLLSIGPVQSFIAQARKLRDLRSGSQLLSELTKAAILAIGSECVIVPGNTTSDSLPNRVLANKSFTTQKEAIESMKAAEKAVKDEWDTIVTEVYSRLPTLGGAANWEQRFKEQTDQLLEIYWAIESYKDDDDYHRAYTTLEARLGAVKNVRTFSQIGSDFNGAETSRKDALTGERDALLFGAGKSNSNSGWPATTDDTLPRRLRERGALVGPNEGLSAISAVKRFRDLGKGDNKRYRENFISTADIALLGIDHKLKQEGIYSISDYLFTIAPTQSGGDGQLAYEENLTPDYFEKQGLSRANHRLDDWRDEFRKLKTSLKESGLKKTSYYTVLAFDGDNVGQWLSGKALGDHVSGAQLKTFHTHIGRLLAAFAQRAKEIVDDSGNGITVYAGGDDYLGALTLDSVFEVLGQLRASFQKLVSKPIQDDYNVDEEFSFSAGLVIAHYKRPLGDTVKLAQQAEKAAKNAGRDALCVRVVKRSGEQQEMTLGWDLKDGESLALMHTRNLVAGLQGTFSRTWLTASARTIAELFGKGEITSDNKEMLLSELRRLLRRSVAHSAIDDHPELRNKGVVAAIPALEYLVEKATAEHKSGAKNLIYALQVIDFLKREMNQQKVEVHPDDQFLELSVS